MFCHILQESSSLSLPASSTALSPKKVQDVRWLKDGNEVSTCSLNTRTALASKDAQAPNELTGPTALGLGVLAEGILGRQRSGAFVRTPISAHLASRLLLGQQE